MLNKFFIPKYIAPLLSLSIILNILRVLIFWKFSFVYILWNIFLALIPFAVSAFLLYLSEENRLNNAIFIIGGIVWLIFLPNAPYIVTDLIHLGVVKGVPIIYDSVLLFTSALVGISLGMNSIYHIEQILLKRFSKRITYTTIVIVMILTSFGMFIGRNLRFNSWDVFVSPLYFWSRLLDILSTSTHHMEALFYSILFFVFIYAVYYSWKFSK